MKIIYCVIAMLILSQATYAAECFVKSGTVTDASGVQVGTGAGIKPCIGKAKNAVVCYENKLEQEICQGVSGEFDLSNTAGDKSSRSIGQILTALFKPEATESYGGKRLKESEYLSGFPYGEVLMPSDVLLFSTSDNVQSSMKSFALYEEVGNDKPLFTVNLADRKIAIPVANLLPGAKYKWVAQSNDKKYSGVFTITQAQDQKEFEEELKEMQSNSDSSISTKHLLRAVLAREYGFTFDMQQSIEAAREAIQQGR